MGYRITASGLRWGRLLFWIPFLAVIVAAPAAAADLGRFVPLDGQFPSQICFERFEDNGNINGAVAIAELDDGIQSVTLIGGQAACLYVTPDQHKFHVESSERFSPDWMRPLQAWRSKTITVSVANHQSVWFRVFPRANHESFYTAPWQVERVQAGDQTPPD